MPILSGTPSSTIKGNPSLSKNIPKFRTGLLLAQESEDGWEVSSLPRGTMGAMVNLSGRQSFDVTPCCSGPAPLSIEAKFGNVTVGITPRACERVGALALELAKMRRHLGAKNVGA